MVLSFAKSSDIPVKLIGFGEKIDDIGEIPFRRIHARSLDWFV